ncbi:class I SAM-dependent methyltransferase [Streptomyces spinosirectus]|uniref:class I SAM-dependent methyltransferase n=1 Tax=Streptomyces TaxID=1883 RepID=UPI000FFEC647|nr:MULTISPECIES: class I SAM-dependent methyltransferase [Streptomyces]MBY8341633.1 class I SAM-dependent methyltransferase [Streptomyces plumbidurans]UIR21460.1 class I SAM-dependent methyltransferase [Streptomyces spinosirectus]
MSHDLETYWNRYGEGVKDEEPAEPLTFGWTQYDGHGPGEELLEQPDTTLELGFGRGRNVAYLARKGVRATGVDISGVQCERARERYGHVPGARFEQGEVCRYLTTAGDDEERFDAIYSVWGALWFTDPERLLPLVRQCLAPRGVLAFSNAPAVPGSYGVQGMYGAGFKGRRLWIYRWAYTPEDWTEILERHGFVDVDAQVLEAPDPENVGTLIVRARAPH